MNTSHVPEKTLPATTFYEFTEDDVKKALSLLVSSRGGLVPDGEIDLMVEDVTTQMRTKFLVRMKVTHGQPAAELEATAVDG